MRNAGRAAFLALALAACALPRHAAAEAKAVTLTLPQARAVMTQAAAEGDARAVRLLALGLVQGGVADGQVHYLLAGAELELGRPVPALKAATRAYRLSGTRAQRFQAAQLAAQAAQASGRTTTAQIWLRRVYQNTDNPEDRAAIARDYRILRQVNPLSFRIGISVAPSNNVNDGSGEAVNRIDGVPFVGLLSPAAQALSGVEISTDLAMSYRLNPLEKGRRISVDGRFYSKQVILSDGAKAKAPTAKNSDYAITLAEAGLTYAGWSETGQRWGVGATAGQAWVGGARYFRYGRGSANYSELLGERTQVGVSGYFEHRAYDGRPTTENIAHASVTLRHVLAGGHRIGARLDLRQSDLTGITRDSRSVRGRLDFSPANRIGPAEVTLGLSAGYAYHPDYMVGFIAVPGGRKDTSVGADIRMTFTDFGYAGFVPTLDIGYARTTSNVSRFETDEVSVGFGIRSAF